jgi:hypothetical protein
MRVWTDSSLPWLVRGVLALVLAALFVSAAAATYGYDPPEAEAGTVSSRPAGETVVAVQGWHVDGRGNENKPARLVAFDPAGDVSWTYDGSERTVGWFYDADPLPNGTLLVVNTIRENGSGKTLVYEFDPATGDRLWTERFDITDTHDAELLGDDRLLVANMRAWDPADRESDDRLFVYDRSEERVVWEWYFRDHYPASTDGGMDPDWTHVNDVDAVGESRILASPRNFDQVVLIDRETGQITLRLGRDDARGILDRQHNPTYLETEDGRPVILVADSENDRVVEYTCVERVGRTCDWERTWTVGTGDLNWPRDANRLPNGNTLITDSRNHRVIEVTPTGRVVWEVYVPWGPFSATRPVHGDEAVRSPTMADLGYRGSYGLEGSAGLTPGTEGGGLTFPEWLRATAGDVPGVGDAARSLADAWAAGAQWVRPAWLAPWAFVHLVAAGLLALAWAAAELVARRRRVVAAVARRVR